MVERFVRTTESPHDAKDWQEIQQCLIRLVGNASYDVKRWPGHVVLVLAKRSGPGYYNLNKTLQATRHLSHWWYLRLALAMLIACMAPYLVIIWRVPPMCPFASNLYRITNATHAMSNATEALLHAAKDKACSMAHIPWVSALSPALFGFFFLLVAIGLDWLIFVITRKFTKKPRRIFHAIAARYLMIFTAPIGSKMERVIMNYIEKPPHSISPGFMSICRYTLRVPLVIGICFYMIEFQLIAQGLHMGSLNYALLLAIFAYHAYFPLMGLILGAKSAMRKVIERELQQCMLQEFGTSSTNVVSGMVEAEQASVSSNVWWRLFTENSSTFSLTLAELELLVEYFKLSQNESNFSVTWHDQHCVTGSSRIHSVYLSDVNMLIRLGMHSIVEDVRAVEVMKKQYYLVRDLKSAAQTGLA